MANRLQAGSTFPGSLMVLLGHAYAGNQPLHCHVLSGLVVHASAAHHVKALGAMQVANGLDCGLMELRELRSSGSFVCAFCCRWAASSKCHNCNWHQMESASVCGLVWPVGTPMLEVARPSAHCGTRRPSEWWPQGLELGLGGLTGTCGSNSKFASSGQLVQGAGVIMSLLFNRPEDDELELAGCWSSGS
jgi:hypothetical protein